MVFSGAAEAHLLAKEIGAPIAQIDFARAVLTFGFVSR